MNISMISMLCPINIDNLIGQINIYIILRQFTIGTGTFSLHHCTFFLISFFSIFLIQFFT